MIFLPDSALGIPASENLTLTAAAGRLHTGKDQQAGTLQTPRKTSSTRFCCKKRQKQNKDGQITLEAISDLHKFSTTGTPVSRAPSTVSLRLLTIL